MLREQILKSLANQNIDVIESIFNVKELENVNSIFCTNVTGITQFKSFNTKKLEILERNFLTVRLTLNIFSHTMMKIKLKDQKSNQNGEKH